MKHPLAFQIFVRLFCVHAGDITNENHGIVAVRDTSVKDYFQVPFSKEFDGLDINLSYDKENDRTVARRLKDLKQIDFSLKALQKEFHSLEFNHQLIEMTPNIQSGQKILNELKICHRYIWNQSEDPKENHFIDSKKSENFNLFMDISPGKINQCLKRIIQILHQQGVTDIKNFGINFYQNKCIIETLNYLNIYKILPSEFENVYLEFRHPKFLMWISKEIFDEFDIYYQLEERVGIFFLFPEMLESNFIICHFGKFIQGLVKEKGTDLIWIDIFHRLIIRFFFEQKENENFIQKEYFQVSNLRKMILSVVEKTKIFLLKEEGKAYTSKDFLEFYSKLRCEIYTLWKFLMTASLGEEGSDNYHGPEFWLIFGLIEFFSGSIFQKPIVEEFINEYWEEMGKLKECWRLKRSYLASKMWLLNLVEYHSYLSSKFKDGFEVPKEIWKYWREYYYKEGLKEIANYSSILEKSKKEYENFLNVFYTIDFYQNAHPDYILDLESDLQEAYSSFDNIHSQDSEKPI